MAGANMDLTPMPAMPLHTNAEALSSAALDRGTPQYHSLRQAMLDAGRPFLAPRSRMVDLSTGNGEWLAPFVEEHEDMCRFIALASSEEERLACRDRFHFRIPLGIVDVGRLDLARSFPEVHSRLTLSNMALGQLSEERRMEVLVQVRKHLEKQGAFIMVEKVAGSDARTHDVLAHICGEHAWNDPGNGSELCTAREWESSLRQAGFKEAECIWRWGPFVAWLALK